MPRDHPLPRADARTEIIDAAVRLLREGGAAAITTRAVAEAAGVQAPTIYRLFGDKDGLVDALAERVMALYVADKSRAVEEARDPVADLRSGWRRHVEFGLTNPELYRLLNSRGGNAPSSATLAGLEVLRTLVRRLATAGLLRVDEDRALMMIHAAGTGTILATLDSPDQHTHLSEAMLDAVLRAILTTAPTAPDSTLSTAVITLMALAPELPALSEAERGLMLEWLSRAIAALQQSETPTEPESPRGR